MSATRAYAVAVVGGVAASAIGFFATSAAWAHVTLAATGMPVDRVSVSGVQSVPVVSAMALVALAGCLAVLATGGSLRRLVGLVVVVAAVVAVVDICVAGGSVADALRERVGSSSATTGGRATQAQAVAGASHTVWRWVALVALVAAGCSGAAVLRQGQRWPSMGRRYEAPAARASTREDDPWTALDRGDDPTV